MTIKAEDFVLNQNIRPEDIDYRNAAELANYLDSIAALTNKCFTVFDYYKNEYYYISQNTDFFCHKKGFEKKGYQFLINHSDEEDIVLMHFIQQRAFRFLQKIEPKERIKYIFSVYVRMVCNGMKYDTNYSVKPQLLDRKGNIWLSLAVLEKTDKYIRPHVRNFETGEIHYFKPLDTSDLKSYTKPLTKQEHLVLTCMAEGLSCKNICNKLKIVESTYKTHRRAIYKKLGADTKLCAINKAFVYGIIK